MARDVDTDKVIEQYLSTALWSSTDDDGDALDDRDYPWVRKAMKEAKGDCESFIAYARETISPDCFDDISDSDIGHNFWLNRNHHGAGFWDRGFTYGDALSKASHTFGSADVYIFRKRFYLA